ncbi:MAG: adenylate/guanylate cyclase domain-containing protein [Spirochaetales bacterium]|nr:adenylate/guanylate cyclase domain-containing protein [Spirochaetales bacterium]
MKAKAFFIKYHVYFYLIICLLANFFVVIASNLASFPFPEDKPLTIWKEFIEKHNILINFIGLICYIVPFALCIIYALPVFPYKTKDKAKPVGTVCTSPQLIRLKTNDKEYIKITVHLPAALALRGISGWICNFILELVFLLVCKYAYHTQIIHILISSLVSYIFLAILSFTIIYFTLETLNRNIVLPDLYPNGNISDTQRMSISSIKGLFLFYFFSAAVFPISFFAVRIFLSRYYKIQIPIYSDMLLVIILLTIGSTLTLLIYHYFHKPLTMLTNGANEISKGNYDCKTVICSNDEMGVLGDSFNAMAKSLKEKEFMRDTFGKIVTPQIRDYLLSENVALGGQTLEVTVMFCDIRGFTTMSETMSPAEIVTLLNEYFTGLEKCITANNGIINKYIGDAVMAIFGAPIVSGTHAVDAYRAALDMRAELIRLNESFQSKHLPTVRFGIGLHSGAVLAGNIGAANRMEYTVIGDAVNTASRIESLCKVYQKDLLISQATADLIVKQDSRITLSDFTFIDEAEIRGRKERVKLYGDEEKML